MISVRFLSILSLNTHDHFCRQQEIMKALFNTAKHEAFEEIHLFIKSRRRLNATLHRMNITLPSKVTNIIELKRMPLNSDFVSYASQNLTNRWVMASNDDVYPYGDAWFTPPNTSLLLSRHAKKNEQTLCGACDATKSQLYQSLCNHANFGSFDAWVAKFQSNILDRIGMNLVHTPRHAFGADNLLGHAFERYFQKQLKNRCYSYKLFHIHCKFPTSVSNPRIRDRGYGDRTFITHGHMARLLLKNEVMTRKKADAVVRQRWVAEF